MSAPTLYVDPRLAGPRAAPGLRLRLKPAHQSCGSVHGTWWPRSTQLFIELRTLLAALYQRLGRIDRVIYDETNWAPASLRMEFRGHSVILDGSNVQSTNTVSVIGELGRLVLLVIPPYTDHARAHASVMKAASPDDVSAADGPLGIGPLEAEARRNALLAHQRRQSDGRALRRRRAGRGASTALAKRPEVRHAQ
jgi:hypothetical protein